MKEGETIDNMNMGAEGKHIQVHDSSSNAPLSPRLLPLTFPRGAAVENALSVLQVVSRTNGALMRTGVTVKYHSGLRCYSL